MISKIQLSPVHIIKDVPTVWPEHGPEVDIVMKPEHLTFAPGSLESIYSFHVLDHLFVDEGVVAMKNWFECLKNPGELFVVVDDFDIIARQYVGGDIDMDIFNNQFNHPTQFCREMAVDWMVKSGFTEGNIILWYANVTDLFLKKETEIVIQGKKV